MFAGFGGDLPVPTAILVVMSKNMFWAVPLMAVLIIAFAVWWRNNKNSESVRKVVDPLKLKLPVFGELFKKVAIARFTRNFSTMMGAGVSHPAVAQHRRRDGRQLGHRGCPAQGAGLRARRQVGRRAARGRAHLPPMVTQMIAVGEDSGALETMLEKIADFYDDEVQSTAEALTALIEPLMIAIIGAVIGGMIVALYMPVFSIFEQIG
jgi:type IV pilus assembly protein PilC